MAEEVPTSGYQAAGGWVGTVQWFGQLLSEQIVHCAPGTKLLHRKSSQSNLPLVVQSP